jgi:hypothetical protein
MIRKAGDLVSAIVQLNGQDLTKGYFSPYIMSVQFVLTNKLYTVKRTYEGIGEFLGNVGGINKILMFAFAVLMAGYNSVWFKQYLINSINSDHGAGSQISQLKHNQISDSKLIHSHVD